MAGRGRGGGRGRGQGSRSGSPSIGQHRAPRVRVKTAKGRKTSSTRWLERQLNDPYVAEAGRLGYRSRAAFKLGEFDDRFHLLAPGKRVVDLGAAPGGWTQVVVERLCGGSGPDGQPRGRVVAVDQTEMDPIPGATILLLDFLSDEAPGEIKAALGGGADVVLSDMASPATGHAATDHLRIMALCEAAFEFAREVLAPGGSFIAKVLVGGTEQSLLATLKREFKTVKHVKPAASRADSAEIYVVALGFRGHPQGSDKQGGSQN
ncbi:MAG: RlmE family RNA methyltransferase [Alphaproteobacteria bacterium]